MVIIVKYRKLPVEIEATQWFKNGDHPKDGSTDTEGDVVRYYRHPDVPGETPCTYCGKPKHLHGWLDTLEGGHTVCPSDWIITGVEGERYPCKDSVFKATYEAC